MFDIADNNILFFYKHNLEGTSCKSSQITGRWRLSVTSLTINWDEAIEEKKSYEIEIVELTNTTLKWKREIRSGVFLEEVFN